LFDFFVTRIVGLTIPVQGLFPNLWTSTGWKYLSVAADAADRHFLGSLFTTGSIPSLSLFLAISDIIPVDRITIEGCRRTPF
jgi:hypothetical protein